MGIIGFIRRLKRRISIRMKRRVIPKDLLADLARKGFQMAFTKDFFSPPIPEPKIVFDESKKQGFSIDTKSWQVCLNVHAAPSYLREEEELVHFFRLISRHEIGHYSYAPYDTITFIKMTIEAKKVFNNEMLAIMISNIVADIVDDVRQSENFGCDPILLDGWLLADLRFEKKIPKPNINNPAFTLFAILMGVKQILWAKRLNPRRCKRIKEILDPLFPRTPFSDKACLSDGIDFLHALKIKVPRKLKSDIEKISKILEKGGLGNIELLPEKTGRIAKIVSRYIPKITDDMLKQIERLLSRLIKGDPKRMVVNPKDIDDPRRLIVEISKDSDSPADAIEAKRLLERYTGTGDSKQRLTDLDALRYWYRAVSRRLIKFEVKHSKPQGTLPEFPVTWEIFDPIEELDILSSLEISPVIIPGLTTIKWVKREYYGECRGKEFPDLLIVIDSSGSMGGIPSDLRDNEETPYHLALVGAFAALQAACRRRVYVSAINFSNEPMVCDWTKNIEKVEDVLLKYQGGGTRFPTEAFDNIIDTHGRRGLSAPILALIITDSDIHNWARTESSILRVLDRGGIVVIFFINTRNIDKEKFSKIISRGAKVYEIRNINDFVGMVVEIVEKAYKD